MFLVVVCHLSNDIQPDVVKIQNWLSYGNFACQPRLVCIYALMALIMTARVVLCVS